LAVLQALDQALIPPHQYHAILVDEAQDFAPSWFTVIRRMLNPNTNMLFIVADAAQKIYRRSFSWRTLAIDVTGNRSRVLNRCYRNTYEILRVAYELVADDSTLRAELQGEGEDVIVPDLDRRRMRHGPLPIILQFDDPARELDHLSTEIRRLVEGGYPYEEIAILHRETKTLETFAAYLRRQGIPVRIAGGADLDLGSSDVKLMTLYGSKGLEFSVVFVAGVDRLQPKPGLSGEELAREVAGERRLLYVAMTRARDRLYVSHAGPAPLWAAAALTMFERPNERQV
jgi:superfamily I DNA/RNA helicase